jgi:hypothetical protein
MITRVDRMRRPKTTSDSLNFIQINLVIDAPMLWI